MGGKVSNIHHCEEINAFGNQIEKNPIKIDEVVDDSKLDIKIQS